MNAPAYGFICLSCGQVWGPEDGYVKHDDPATGVKCRDVTGSSSVPTKLGPVAESPWGPLGIYAELHYDATYDGGCCPPSAAAVAHHEREGEARIERALGTFRETC